MTPEFWDFTRRVLASVTITATVVLVILLLGFAADVFLLVFAGILLAVFLRGSSTWLSAHTPFTGGWSLTIVVLALTGILGVAAWLLASRVAAQVDQLAQQLPHSAQRFEEVLRQYGWGRHLIADTAKFGEWVTGKANVFARATGIVSTTFGVLTNCAMILFIGIFFAAEPRRYLDGVVRLVPTGKRNRARQVLSALGCTLRWWLLGRLITLTEVGVLTASKTFWVIPPRNPPAR